MTSSVQCARGPWIAELLLEHGTARNWYKSAPVQVIELVPLENWIKEAGYESAVVVYISDLKYRIKAVLTEEAGSNIQQEEENYTLSQLKNKVVILKKFNIQVRLELELRDCEFYLVVQDLKILPGEMGSADARSCNMDLAVQKKLRELRDNHLNNTVSQEKTFTDLSLSNMINAAVEDEVKVLKHAAELCLDPVVASKVTASTSRSESQTTGWKTMRRQNTDKRNIFTVPEAMLMISSPQEEALNNIKEEQEDLSSQNPWDAVSPASLVGIPSSGETCISCPCTSESCKRHGGKHHAHCSTLVDVAACSELSVGLQLPNVGTQDDLDKSVELYTAESQRSEAQCAKGPLCSPATSAENGRNTIYATELKEDNGEKSTNSTGDTNDDLFKNLSPLTGSSVTSSGLNCVSSFKNLTPVSAMINGGQLKLSKAAYDDATVTRNNILETEKQLDTRGEEHHEITRAAKRKRQFMDAEDQMDGKRVYQGTSCSQAGAEIEDGNSSNLNSDETIIDSEHCEEIANDVCKISSVTRHKESHQKKKGRMNKIPNDIALNNVPGNKMAVVSTKYKKLDFVSKSPSQQVQNCKGQPSTAIPNGQHTEDIRMHALHQHHENEPRRHSDGSRFLYSYPPPTAELIAQVNSIRVSSDLLNWAVSYLSGTSLSHD
ncbi:adrenocortical dysplasia protein homolog isoform X2 [Rhinoraja longicauda]